VVLNSLTFWEAVGLMIVLFLMAGSVAGIVKILLDQAGKAKAQLEAKIHEGKEAGGHGFSLIRAVMGALAISAFLINNPYFSNQKTAYMPSIISIIFGVVVAIIGARERSRLGDWIERLSHSKSWWGTLLHDIIGADHHAKEDKSELEKAVKAQVKELTALKVELNEQAEAFNNSLSERDSLLERLSARIEELAAEVSRIAASVAREARRTIAAGGGKPTEGKETRRPTTTRAKTEPEPELEPADSGGDEGEAEGEGEDDEFRCPHCGKITSPEKRKCERCNKPLS
jgi:methyl-accepting chemotaxis protein